MADHMVRRNSIGVVLSENNMVRRNAIGVVLSVCSKILIFITFDPEIPLWRTYSKNINQHIEKSWCANTFFRGKNYPNV